VLQDPRIFRTELALLELGGCLAVPAQSPKGRRSLIQLMLGIHCGRTTRAGGACWELWFRGLRTEPAKLGGDSIRPLRKTGLAQPSQKRSNFRLLLAIDVRLGKEGYSACRFNITLFIKFTSHNCGVLAGLDPTLKRDDSLMKAAARAAWC